MHVAFSSSLVHVFCFIYLRFELAFNKACSKVETFFIGRAQDIALINSFLQSKIDFYSDATAGDDKELYKHEGEV